MTDPTTPSGGTAELAGHWDAAYAGGDATVSWHQDEATRSLACITATTPDLDAPIIDVGGGSSPLAGALVARGCTDVTVLDISAAALRLARERLGAGGAAVTWLVADLRSWTPPRRYAVWHDRAVLHFLLGDEDRAHYAAIVDAALAPGGHAIIASFAPDGPERCSGLPVRRASAEDLLALLGPGFAAVRSDDEQHRTPSGREQHFAWLVARKLG